MSNFLNKTILAALVLAVVIVSSLPALGATPGSNPIITDVYTADPAPLVVGNTAYLYTGHDEPNSSFYTMNNWRCYSSQDMTNWTSYGSILSYTNFTWATSNGAWASQCVQKNGKFYWYVALSGSGSYGGFNIGVAVSDNPTGPFTDARGTPLITDGMTTGGDAWDDIDPTVFTDTNGVSWLGWGHGTFYLAQLATNMTALAGSIQVNRNLTNLPYYTEGPFLHRHGNLYYLSYASIDGGGEKIRYVTATNITGPWTPHGLVTGYAANSYTIQDGIFDFNGQSYLVYHNGTLSGGGSFDRSVCLDYLYYNPDGTIQPVFQTTAGVSVPPRNDNLQVGFATQAWPANGAANVPWSPILRWLAGSNAVAHTVYVGTSSNAVAQATFASPEYQGTSATTNFTPGALVTQTMYFWRVDEIRGTNISHGAVGWFTTEAFLAHRYSFSESGGNSVGDSAGGPAWTGTLPNGGTLAGGQLALLSSSQQYVSLPAGIVNQLGGLTLMAWVNLVSTNTWNRIFDFGIGTTTYMYLTPVNNGGTLQFAIKPPGGSEQTMSSSALVSTGTWHQVAVTLSGNTGIPGMSGAGGSGVLYLDGVKVGSTEDFTVNPASLGNTANDYLGKSQTSSDPYLNGAIDEFRIYNGVLAPSDIAQAYFAGPAQIGSNSGFPWMTQDVGAVGLTGSATFRGSVFTAAGSGSDIWGAADAFRFVYVTNSGDCTIVARVASVQNIDPWSKAGVMIRESLATNAANAFIAVTPSNGVTWQDRSTTGGNTVNTATPSLTAPYWVKLVRSGNTFTGYRSPDGTNWTQQGTATFTMASTAYVGLVLTSHNNSTLCNATFDNVTAPGWPIAQNPVPGGLAAAAVSSSQINLVWNTFTNAASYKVKRSLTNGGPYAVVATGVTATNYPDSGLNAGTVYYYVVSAVVSGSGTSNSVPVAATTLSGSYGTLIHRYSFSESGGSSVADSIGGPVWNGALPNGGTLSGGQLALSAGASQYASLPAGIVGGLSNFTVVAWVNLNSPTNWSRIFDFGANTTTNLFLTPQNGNTGTLRFSMTTNGGGNEQQINCGSVLTTGVWHEVAVTLNGGTGVLYLDGAAVGTNAGLTLNPAILGSTANNYLGKSQYPDPYFDGQLDEFSIYGSGLSAAEVAATYALGPNQLLNTNSPVVLPSIGGGNMVMTWSLASAGYTLQLRTNLVLGNWVNVTSPAPQIFNGQWQVPLPLSGNANSTFYRLVK